MVVRLWWQIDKRALVITAGCLVLWRLLNAIPVVGISHDFLITRLGLYDVPGTFPAIGSHSIAFDSYSLNYFGIRPYIEILVVVSLATVCFDRLKALVNSAGGRLRLERWIRAAAIVWAASTAYGWIGLAQNAGALPATIEPFTRLTICLEMAGGTAVMIMLAGALDEYGLGFGYGAILFYALDIFALGLHRVADYVAYTPSLEAMYRPLAVWGAFSLGIVIAGVAIFLAYRRVWTNEDDDEPSPTDLKLVMPGFLRPPLLAFAMLGIPGSLAQIAGSNVSALNWLADHWSPYGSVAWLDATYVATEAALLIVFSIGVVWIDWGVTELPWDMSPTGLRLAAITGVFLALLIAMARPAAHFATEAAGQLIAVSGFNVLLVAGTLLLVILCIEGRRHPLVTTEAQLP